MARDPVCNMDVDEMTEYKSTYKGEIYYFSSAECKDRFDTNPGQYVFHGEGEHPEQGGEGKWAEAAREKGGRLQNRARTQAIALLSKQKERTINKLDSIYGALKSSSQHLHDREQDTIADYSDRAAEKVNRLSRYIQERQSEEILDEIEHFLRQRPALFIGAAFGTGLILARFLKSSRSA